MFKIVPLDRDGKAKKMYKFLRWYMRRNRRKIESEIEKAFEEYLLDGKKQVK